MPSVYKNPGGQRAVRQWCSQALAQADFPLTSATLVTSVGRVELTSAGAGRPRVVLVPGTGFNAAVTLPWLQALSARWATTVVDLPGQPGLSDPSRPRRAARLVRPSAERDPRSDGCRRGCAGRQLAGRRRGPGRRLAPNRGAGADLTGRLHPPQGGPETGAGVGCLAAAPDSRTHPPHAPVVRRSRRGPARDRGGMDGPDGRLLPHDAGPAAPARRNTGPVAPNGHVWSGSENMTGSCHPIDWHRPCAEP